MARVDIVPCRRRARLKGQHRHYAVNDGHSAKPLTSMHTSGSALTSSFTETCNGFLNRVSQVRFLPGAHTNPQVSGPLSLSVTELYDAQAVLRPREVGAGLVEGAVKSCRETTLLVWKQVPVVVVGHGDG